MAYTWVVSPDYQIRSSAELDEVVDLPNFGLPEGYRLATMEDIAAGRAPDLVVMKRVGVS